LLKKTPARRVVCFSRRGYWFFRARRVAVRPAAAGGGFCCGVAFKLDETGTETVLHSFTGGADGADLMGLFRNPEGNLYSTTSNGALGFGAVFKLDSTGKQTVL
jgi:hypothetical protein